MTDFKNGQELLEVCKKKQCSISEVMKQREIKKLNRISPMSKNFEL